MLRLLFKISIFCNSEKYKYVDIFLGLLFLLYFFYLFFLKNESGYYILLSSVTFLIFGIFDLTRKIKNQIENKIILR